MENTPIASFNFEGFKIIKSYFEMNNSDENQTFSINFNPKGIINKETSKFEMELGVLIEEQDINLKLKLLFLEYLNLFLI